MNKHGDPYNCDVCHNTFPSSIDFRNHNNCCMKESKTVTNKADSFQKSVSSPIKDSTCVEVIDDPEEISPEIHIDKDAYEWSNRLTGAEISKFRFTVSMLRLSA